MTYGIDLVLIDEYKITEFTGFSELTWICLLSFFLVIIAAAHCSLTTAAPAFSSCTQT